MKKKVLSILLSFAVVTAYSLPCFADVGNIISTKMSGEKTLELEEDLKNVESVSELGDVLETSNLSSKCIDEEIADVIEANIDEDIIEEFVDSKTEDAIEAIEDIGSIEMHECGYGIYMGYKEIDLGDGCRVQVKVTDEPEKTVAKRLFEPISNALLLTAYASEETVRSGSTVKWKKYGNRMYTAAATIYFVVGSVTFALENHYILSKDGIKEQTKEKYLVAYTQDGGAVSSSHETPIVETKTASKIGKSVCVTCKFKAQYGINPVQWGREYKMYAYVKYVDMDKSAKEVKVNQAWELNKLVVK